MTTLRRIYLRAYPALVTLSLCVANRVMALDVPVVDQDGQAASKAALVVAHAGPQNASSDRVAASVPQPLQTERMRKPVRDRIRLSQAAIPPGDPVLSVDVPENAREVLAYFPFGLVKRLQLDARRGQWVARFLVPRDVKDGKYTINVRIVGADGRVGWKSIEYLIDGTEPELTVLVDRIAWAGDSLHVSVDPLEPVKEVYVSLPEVSKARVRLKLRVETGLYEGKIRVPLDFPRDQLRVRVVAHDLARNRVQEEVVVPVTFDGC